MNTKKIAILGGGESGVGAALLAKKLNYEVFLSDYGKIKEKYITELKTNAIPYEETQHTLEKIFEATEVIKSPGIPEHTSIIRAIKKRGIPVISEIEFAGRHTNAKIIGITGSNGKTTTTKLTCHLLKTAGYSVGIGGNVGRSFARNITEQSREYYVLELSSFQLDGIVGFKPDVAILLNITPDHLDRYEYKMENYIRSKFRIAGNQDSSDLFIYNGEDSNIQSYLKDYPVASCEVRVAGCESGKNKFCFSKRGNQLKIESQVGGDSPLGMRGLLPGAKTEGKGEKSFSFDVSQCSLKGSHNYFNATCAILAAKSVGVSDEAIQEGLNTFQNAPHRLESVATINGVEYINDSKATNVDSVYYALKAMEKPVIWIAGGKDKGNVYDPIMDLVEEKVKALICLGVDNQKLIETFSPMLKIIEETKSAKEAVERATIYSEEGDVVLLSPACASFDLFKNYENRGDLFKESVQKLNTD